MYVDEGKRGSPARGRPIVRQRERRSTGVTTRGPESAHHGSLRARRIRFLARLPAIHQPNLRIGHFDRRVPPPGTARTLSTGSQRIRRTRTSAGCHQEDRRRSRETRCGTAKGGEAIVGVHLGRFDHLVDEDAAKFPRIRDGFRCSRGVAAPQPAGADWDVDGATTFGDTGLRVTLERIEHAKSLVISLDGNDEYRITLLRVAETIHRFRRGADTRGRRRSLRSTPSTCRQAWPAGATPRCESSPTAATVITPWAT